MEQPGSLRAISPRPKLGDEATRLLRDAVISGDYPAGTRMAVDELAQQFQVSTMPIREALVALANEGLLVALPRRGFRVAPLGAHDFEDVFLIHSLAAGVLAGRAAEVADDALIDRLDEVQREIVAASRLKRPFAERAFAIEQLNYQFHRLIHRASDSERLRWFLRASTRFVPRKFYEQIPGWVDATVNEHPAIIAALRAHDSLAAKQLMTAHVIEAGRLVVSQMAAASGAQGAADTRLKASPSPLAEPAFEKMADRRTAGRRPLDF